MKKQKAVDYIGYIVIISVVVWCIFEVDHKGFPTVLKGMILLLDIFRAFLFYKTPTDERRQYKNMFLLYGRGLILHPYSQVIIVFFLFLAMW